MDRTLARPIINLAINLALRSTHLVSWLTKPLRSLPRMWFPVLVFSASYLLLDAVAALTLSRLIYICVRNTFRQLCTCFRARLQARLSSRSAALHANLLLLGSNTWPSGESIVPSTQWNGGGIGGTNLPDSAASNSGTSRVLRPFAHRLERISTATNTTRAEANGETSPTTAAQRRDWIAVTDPQRRIEVPVYPEISSLVNVLTYEALDTRVGHRLRTFARWATRFIRINDDSSDTQLCSPTVSSQGTTPQLLPTETTTMAPLIFHTLPEELISHILLLAACPSLSPHEPRSSPTSILLLSRRYYNLILPRLYHSVSLHTPSSFRSFRVTLALHNPSLGRFVRKLQIGSSEFDSSGYCPSALADHGPLSVGIEQMLLASPRLEELSLDLFSMGALHTGTIARLEKGPQPTRLCTELTTIPYLSLPTFEDLRELELLVFGMDDATARELRVTLPLLERLELRLVTRRRGSAFRDGQDTWSPTQLPTFDEEEDGDVDEEVQEEDRNTEADISRGRDDGDVFQLESDMQEFIEALHLLRTWPGGDERMGKTLKEITVFAWPSAVRRLRKTFGEVQVRRNGDGAVETPIRIELDRGYLLGPRRGAHVLWRKDRARAAWAT
ncbi:hypothetical protein PSEUBRA_000109 [Kalmanozyma brasiliensis GHG001]|uniref:uncharacterized protein n=1 Tax=Kalmanozyma brasiliensis (strain GHG001) TaxID=1365824 RepID=UPI002867EC2B|nr:uncharacterized protein PSEUBRA_000109 [Kalmanozyma brasiliensis GHG001]KAF6766780.1 hypothetical protein PSEUBRA_000109 [Kalmanozyma brasiliensis GHG001]